jgi:hypothetical protein
MKEGVSELLLVFVGCRGVSVKVKHSGPWCRSARTFQVWREPGLEGA